MCDIKDMMTGQVYPNLTVAEVAKMLKVSEPHIYRVRSKDLLVSNRYRVTKREDSETTNRAKLPQELLEEWDHVTSKFREYYGGTK
jgi:AcrR family transcriptional regulator